MERVPLHPLIDPSLGMGGNAHVVSVRLEEMLAAAGPIHDPGAVEELHELRIAIKHLRYALEIFSVVLRPEVKAVLRRIETLQEHLGAIHDCDIRIPFLQDCLSRETVREQRRLRKHGLPPALAAEGIAPLILRIREERDRRYAEFLAEWDTPGPQALADSVRALSIVSSA